MRLYRYLEYPITLMREQIVGRDDVIEWEMMRDHYTQIDPSRGDDIHQTPHAFLAARAEGGVDLVITEAGGESGERDF